MKKLAGIFVVISLWACSGSGDALKKGLSFAGNNREELERVLEHYSHDPADSLKLRAAQFLIANMPYHYGYYGAEVNRYANIFSLIDTFSYIHENVSNEDKSHIGDSVIRLYGLPDLERAQKRYDSHIITARYLIRNIDVAFIAWQQAPWGTKISFDDFCEYILPYRIKSERIDNWRPAYYHRYMKIAKGASRPSDPADVFASMKWHLGTETGFNAFFDKYFPFDQSIGDIEKGRIGSCKITAFVAVTAMRATGLPVGYDYIMHWGSSNSRHYMPALVGGLNIPRLITNENVQEDTWHLVDFSSEFNTNRHKFLATEMPQGLYVQNVRTIPKVYRFTYSQSTELLAINKEVDEQYISPEFRESNLKDVTDEYVTTGKLEIPVAEEFVPYKVGYLCVFDITGWQPVAITRIKDHKLMFDKVGRKTMYIPTVYHDGQHQPVGDPFYIDSLNKIHHFTALPEKKQEMTLLRKYPLYTYSAYHSEILKGGRFEGSDDPQFRHPVLLHEIKEYPFFVNIVPVAAHRPCRYYRYVAPADANFEPDNIAEVQFLDEQNQPLKGSFAGIEGIAGHEIEKAFDGDLNSYYQNYRIRDGWIGIDAGAGNKKMVKSVMFCPRNDTNGIIPGQEYELYYWDGSEWISLGAQEAGEYALHYKNVPSNALLWLRCNSGGLEERIFTYENGMQLWW